MHQTRLRISTQKAARVTSVDALRGFAILSILLLHSIEHFIYNVYPSYSSPVFSSIDNATKEAFFFLFAGKSYAIFALLFGFTFGIQYKNRQLRGEDFCGRFAWRLILLAGFATINAMFFPGGDILMFFAIMGFVLIPVRKLSPKWLLVAASFFLIQPLELFYTVYSLVNPGWTPHLFLNESHYPALENILKTGEWLPMIWANITTGQIASFLWTIDAGRFFQSPGLFILGLYLARSNRFDDTTSNTDFWAKTLVICSIATTGLYILKSGFLPTIPLGKALTMWYNAVFCGALVSSFLLAYRSASFQARCNPLRQYGKMSLTNYIGQSVFGALIFFPCGLDLAPHLGFCGSLIAGMAIAWTQIKFSSWWLGKHKLGPMEQLWHKLTWIHSPEALGEKNNS